MSRWIRTLLLAGLAMPALAHAQEGPKPEIMLMIDGSHKMGRPIDFRDVVCQQASSDLSQLSLPWSWAQHTYKTPLNMVKEALLGTVQAPNNQRWCVRENRGQRQSGHELGVDGDWPHVRQMCCDTMNGDACATWSPCYADNGQGSTPDQSALDLEDAEARTQDGLLTTYRDSIKFGVMFTESKFDTSTGPDGHYSYGNDGLNINAAPIDVGARGPVQNGRLHVGALIGPDWGQWQGGAIDDAAVGDDDSKVRRHNALVQRVVSRLVPHGVPVLSAFMHDAKKFHDAQGPLCRQRSAVLITRGYDEPLQAGWAPGRPYQPAADYAAELKNSGVKVHVILIGTEGEVGQKAWAQQVASAGGGNFYFAPSAKHIRRALRRIIDGQRGGRQSRNRALVISASPADYCENGFRCQIPDDAVLQWRIGAYGRTIDGTTYGRIRAQQMTCANAVRNPARPGVPQPLDAPLAYDAMLAERSSSARRTVALRPGEAEAMVITGGASAGFSDRGENLMGDDRLMASLLGVDENAVNEAIASDKNDEFDEDVEFDDDVEFNEDVEIDENVGFDEANSVDDVPAAPTRGQAAGLLLNGFFGARGLGDGAQRQLGATISGDLVSLTAPSLGLSDPDYLTYRQIQEGRKTLVATGARDGLIHVFRAKDGVEVVNFMPSAAWKKLVTGEAPVDGPLGVADIVPCRRLDGAGGGNCPADLTFEAWMFGGTGRSAANIFGVRIKSPLDLANNADRQLDLDGDVGRADGLWDKTQDDISESVAALGGNPENTLGSGTSRPAVTHVRDGDAVRAALIVGCGEGDPNAGFVTSGPGRCVLVLEATTGRVIRSFDTTSSAAIRALIPSTSFSGSPVAFPAGGITPASRAYIGDAMGRIWRMDLRDSNPEQWTIEIAWPPANNAAEADGYELGRGVADRPSVAVRPDGAVVVGFATQADGEGDASRSYAVSFTDKAIIDDDGVNYAVTRNWMLPLRDNEYATGAPVVRDEVFYLTTREESDDVAVCSTINGRLYGLHYYKPYVDSNGDRATYRTSDTASSDALPALETTNEENRQGHKALSLVLPPGRVAYGLAIARTPSCSPDQPATTAMVLNVADRPPNREVAAVGAVEQAQVEVVRNGVVQAEQLDGNIFMAGQGQTLEICLDCTADGAPAQGDMGHAQELPFPSQVVYWGSTFLN